MVSYRSGPEWEERFDQQRDKSEPPSFKADFNIERYLDFQGERMARRYDPNSFLYISKAMDMFNIGQGFASMEEGMARIKCPTLVLGVQSDILFPVHQQQEITDQLR